MLYTLLKPFPIIILQLILPRHTLCTDIPGTFLIYPCACILSHSLFFLLAILFYKGLMFLAKYELLSHMSPHITISCICLSSRQSERLKFRATGSKFQVSYRFIFWCIDLVFSVQQKGPVKIEQAYLITVVIFIFEVSILRDHSFLHSLDIKFMIAVHL